MSLLINKTGGSKSTWFGWYTTVLKMMISHSYRNLNLVNLEMKLYCPSSMRDSHCGLRVYLRVFTEDATTCFFCLFKVIVYFFPW